LNSFEYKIKSNKNHFNLKQMKSFKFFEENGSHYEIEILGCDTPVLWSAMKYEVPLIVVEPRHRITGTIEFQKFNLMRSVGPVAVVLSVVVCPLAPGIVLSAVPERQWCDGSIPCGQEW
jgi:hypothetical protein